MNTKTKRNERNQSRNKNKVKILLDLPVPRQRTALVMRLFSTSALMAQMMLPRARSATRPSSAAVEECQRSWHHENGGYHGTHTYICIYVFKSIYLPIYPFHITGGISGIIKGKKSMNNCRKYDKTKICRFIVCQ